MWGGKSLKFSVEVHRISWRHSDCLRNNSVIPCFLCSFLGAFTQRSVLAIVLNLSVSVCGRHVATGVLKACYKSFVLRLLGFYLACLSSHFCKDCNVSLLLYVTWKGHTRLVFELSWDFYLHSSGNPDLLLFCFFLCLPVESKRKHGTSVTACCYWKEAEVTLGLASRPIHAIRLGVWGRGIFLCIIYGTKKISGRGHNAKHDKKGLENSGCNKNKMGNYDFVSSAFCACVV